VIDAVGESTRIGAAPAMHVHPEYQLQVADAVVGDFGLSFRLTTTSQQYRASDVVDFLLTNNSEPATPTGPPATSTPSPTAEATEPPTVTATVTATNTSVATPTPTPSATPPLGGTCDSDCDGDGTVSVAELIRGVNIALGKTIADGCRSFDIDRDGAVSVKELINAVRDALYGC
jgi:hypothetical protein